MAASLRNPASYRDPSGHVFTQDGVVYRQVNVDYKEAFLQLHSSGLYDALVQKGWLLPHTDLQTNLTGDAACFTTLKPVQLPYIFYPFEWTFSMLKEAAMLTLQIAQTALQHGLMLKDATPYNVQFYNGGMVFIDSLSFEMYTEGRPWIAYRQACESFLAPLALMHFTGKPLQPLLLVYPEGIPLAVAKALLPRRSRWHINTYLHIHLNASYSTKKPSGKVVHLPKQKLLLLLQSLESCVRHYRLRPHKDVWAEYYQEAAGRDGYLEEKKALVKAWIDALPPFAKGIDVGGNTGEFAALLLASGAEVICADGEHWALEKLYDSLPVSKAKLFPVLMDFAAPSPAIGVNNKERPSFITRAAADVVLALAVVHHLAIGRNILFSDIAEMFAALGRTLIVEFVPKTDEKIQLMLTQKADIYSHYTEAEFVAAFAQLFTISKREEVGRSGRSLFLMHRL